MKNKIKHWPSLSSRHSTPSSPAMLPVLRRRLSRTSCGTSITPKVCRSQNNSLQRPDVTILCCKIPSQPTVFHKRDHLWRVDRSRANPSSHNKMRSLSQWILSLSIWYQSRWARRNSKPAPTATPTIMAVSSKRRWCQLCSRDQRRCAIKRYAVALAAWAARLPLSRKIKLSQSRRGGQCRPESV